eukprot:CAMPEP_0195275092 /NCGR_PEP_ID=MMETSP0706-20130129/17608_1 /TAXON_ID=33640 /ORGANISM="Asterionellopsis glacialis, Strain CCMP134" /LENGTH=30 /DNA_ID= /DNA_START= /DNA_END= /DNA_ORIENTATION=
MENADVLFVRVPTPLAQWDDFFPFSDNVVD